VHRARQEALAGAGLAEDEDVWQAPGRSLMHEQSTDLDSDG
jgi:hypothetical protein